MGELSTLALEKKPGENIAKKTLFQNFIAVKQERTRPLRCNIITQSQRIPGGRIKIKHIGILTFWGLERTSL